MLIKTMFSGLFNLLLWAGSALCFIAYGIDPLKDATNLYLGIVLAVVVSKHTDNEGDGGEPDAARMLGDTSRLRMAILLLCPVCCLLSSVGPVRLC